MNHRIASGLLGASDGTCSIAGVIAGGAAAGIGHNALAVTAIGGALAATVSMGGAEMLAEDATDWGAIGAMGTGTLLGSALPALPLLAMSGHAAWGAVLAVSLLIGLAVGWVRARTTHRTLPQSIAQTLAVLALGGAVGYAAGTLG